MSTNAWIGTATTENAARVAYLHWDGTPTGVLPSLREIAKREGSLAAAMSSIVDGGSWSTLDETVVDYAAMTIPDTWANAPCHSVEAAAWRWKDSASNLTPVAGVGLRVNVESGAAEVRPFDGNTLPGVGRGIEWAYILTGDTLHVLWGSHKARTRDMTTVATFTLDELASATPDDFQAVYVGSEFTRTNLMAYAVVEDLPDDARGLTARQWFGFDPITAAQAVGIRYQDGRRVDFTGGYSAGQGWRKQWATDASGREYVVELRTDDQWVPIVPEGAEFVLPLSRDARSAAMV